MNPSELAHEAYEHAQAFIDYGITFEEGFEVEEPQQYNVSTQNFPDAPIGGEDMGTGRPMAPRPPGTI